MRQKLMQHGKSATRQQKVLNKKKSKQQVEKSLFNKWYQTIGFPDAKWKMGHFF